MMILFFYKSLSLSLSFPKFTLNEIITNLFQLVGWFFFGSFLIVKGAILQGLNDGRSFRSHSLAEEFGGQPNSTHTSYKLPWIQVGYMTNEISYKVAQYILAIPSTNRTLTLSRTGPPQHRLLTDLLMCIFCNSNPHNV